MTDNQAKKYKLVQEGVSKYDFEDAEAVVAVDTYLEESRSGESFGSFLLRDGWIDGSKVEAAGGRSGYEEDDDDDDNYDDVDEAYFSVDNNLGVVTKEKLSLESPDEFEFEDEEGEEEDDDNDVYSSIEGEVRGLNKHGFPAVTAKVGKESEICCKKTLHVEDQAMVQKHSVAQLMKAAKTVAHEIDTGDFIDTEVVAGAFLEDVLKQAEKDFGILRHKFKKHHAAKAVAEFLRFAEDKQPGEATLSTSRHYLGCLARDGRRRAIGAQSLASNSFDRDDSDSDSDIEHGEIEFPPVGALVKIFKKKSKDIKIVKDMTPTSESASSKRKTPLKDPTDGVKYGRGKDMQSYLTLAKHHASSQEDEIWISARNIVQWTEFSAVRKMKEKSRKEKTAINEENTGIFLMQAAYYCSAAEAAIPKSVPSKLASEKIYTRNQSVSHTKTMIYRALVREQEYPGQLGHLDPSQGPNKYNPGHGSFDTLNFKKFDESAFEKSEVHFFGLPKRPMKTLRRAELDLSGILQSPKIMSGHIDQESTEIIQELAEKHMSKVIPALLKDKKQGVAKVQALMRLFSWNFVRLYQSALLYPKGKKHGEWLLQQTLNGMPNRYYYPKLLVNVRSKFKDAFSFKESINIPDKTQSKYQGSAQRIGASMTLNKTRSIVNGTTATTTTPTNSQAFDLCAEMEASAVKLLSSAKGIAPKAPVVLLVPIKNSYARKTLARSSRQELQAAVPSFILHQTGKFEFRSLQGEIYSAISKNSRDLRHVETGQDIHFETDTDFQCVEYQGGGPTFLIAAVDLGTHSSLP